MGGGEKGETKQGGEEAELGAVQRGEPPVGGREETLLLLMSRRRKGELLRPPAAPAPGPTEVEVVLAPLGETTEEERLPGLA